MEQFHQGKENTSKIKDLLKVIPFFFSPLISRQPFQSIITLYHTVLNHSCIPHTFVRVTQAADDPLFLRSQLDFQQMRHQFIRLPLN